MEFSVKFSTQDLDDLRVLLRPRFYWAKYVLANFHGAALLGVVIWASVLALFGRTNPNWWFMGALWALLVGLFVWAFYSVRRERAQALAALNADMPNRTSFATDGVRWNRADGVRGFMPWGEFTGFREHGRVLSLDVSPRKSAVFVPVGHLSDFERQQLRDFLRAHLPS